MFDHGLLAYPAPVPDKRALMTLDAASPGIADTTEAGNPDARTLSPAGARIPSRTRRGLYANGRAGCVFFSFDDQLWWVHSSPDPAEALAGLVELGIVATDEVSRLVIQDAASAGAAGVWAPATNRMFGLSGIVAWLGDPPLDPDGLFADFDGDLDTIDALGRIDGLLGELCGGASGRRSGPDAEPRDDVIDPPPVPACIPCDIYWLGPDGAPRDDPDIECGPPCDDGDPCTIDMCVWDDGDVCGCCVHEEDPCCPDPCSEDCHNYAQKCDAGCEGLDPDCCPPEACDPGCESIGAQCEGGCYLGNEACCPPEECDINCDDAGAKCEGGCPDADPECCNDPCCVGPASCCGSPDPCCDPGNECCGNPDRCCIPTNPCCGSPDPCCNPDDPCCGDSDRCCNPDNPCCESPDPCCNENDPCCGNPDRCCNPDNPCCQSEDPCCNHNDPCCGNTHPCCNPDNPDCGNCNEACCNSTDPCCNNPDRCCGVTCPPCQHCEEGACVSDCDPMNCETCQGGQCAGSCDPMNCEACQEGACVSTCNGALCETCQGGQCASSCDPMNCEECQGGTCVQDIDDGDPCTYDCCVNGSAAHDDLAWNCSLWLDPAGGCPGAQVEISFRICNVSEECDEYYTWTLDQPPSLPPGYDGLLLGLPQTGNVFLGPGECQDVATSVTIAAESPIAPAPLDLIVESSGTNECNPGGDPPTAGCYTAGFIMVDSVVDLTFDSISDTDEWDPGGFLALNDDDDNNNGTPDKDESGATAGEDDLVQLSISADPGLSGTVQLSAVAGASRIKLYQNGDRSGPVALPASWPAADLPVTLWVEGFQSSAAARDVELKLLYTGSGGPCEDRVKLTVVDVDLDVDSDNNNVTGSPDRSPAEEAAEDREGDPAYPGKFVEVNDDDSDADGIPDFADGFDRDGTAGSADDQCAGEALTALVLEIPVPIPITDPEQAPVARLRLAYADSDPAATTRTGPAPKHSYAPAAGNLRIWTETTGRQKTSVVGDPPGHYWPSGEYNATDLGYAQGQRVQTFYIEGVAPGLGLAGDAIVVEVDPDGSGPAGWVVSDTVRLTVVRAGLGIDSNNDGVTDGFDEPIEAYSPGCVLPKDLEGDGPGADHLEELLLAAAPLLAEGKVELTADPDIRIWTDPSKTTEIVLPKTYDPASTMPASVFVDGAAKNSTSREIRLEYKYSPSGDLRIGDDAVRVLVTETPSWAPARGNAAYLWSSLPSLGTGDGVEFENQIKDQGYQGNVRWYSDATGSADNDFKQCTLLNYKEMRNCGIFTVISHGGAGAHYALYATDTPAGQTACDSWRAGEIDMSTERWPGDCYTVRVSSKWLAANWAGTLSSSKAITIWSICYSATGNPTLGEAAVKEAAGGRWRVGYINPTYEGECITVNRKFLERMNGAADQTHRRTAGAAYDNKTGYPPNVQMDGNDWTTLCPSPAHDSDGPVFPPDGGNPELRHGWGCIIFDTYMEDSCSPTAALMRVTGAPTGDHRWAGQTAYGSFMLGFHYDKTGGTATTMKAVADKCRNKDPDGGRELDGDRQKPNKDDRSWSF